MPRPHVIASVITSLDGYIDDLSAERLILSSPEDLAAVDALRADVDAIMVGAETVRRDHARLLVRDPALRAARVRDGRAPSPRKLTLTRAGRLDAAEPFFTESLPGMPRPLVIRTQPGDRTDYGDLAEVIELPNDPHAVLDQLGKLGIQRLLVEGGSRLHTWFLAADAVDELRMAIAPFLLGEADAPRFTVPASYPPRRWRCTGTAQLGDCAVLHFLKT